MRQEQSAAASASVVSARMPLCVGGGKIQQRVVVSQGGDELALREELTILYRAEPLEDLDHPEKLPPVRVTEGGERLALHGEAGFQLLEALPRVLAARLGVPGAAVALDGGKRTRLEDAKQHWRQRAAALEAAKAAWDTAEALAAELDGARRAGWPLQANPRGRRVSWSGPPACWRRRGC